jgi:hypothetical protein
MAIQWQTETSLWLEDEISGHFELAAQTGSDARQRVLTWRAQQTPGRVAEVAQWLGASLPKDCDCAPVFPPGFAFCPHCGSALQVAAPVTQATWLGPFADHSLPEHVPKGVGYSGFSLAAALPHQATRPEASLPAPPAPGVFFSGDFGFAATRLLVLAYRQNLLQYWNPNVNDWQLFAAELDNLASHGDLAFIASDYYCLRPINQTPGAVALIPTTHGLMQLVINPIALSYQLEAILVEALVSAPGRVFQHIACLYQHQDQVFLWTLAGNEEARYCCEMPSEPALMAGWSRPIAYQGKLFWLHAQGHLLWQPGNAPKWLPWPVGWQPRHASTGPMQSRDGRLWLLGQQQHAYSFLELGLTQPLTQPLMQPQQEATDGARLGFGRFIFRLGHPLHGEPWGSFTLENENDHHALVWPLLACYDSDKHLRGGLVLRLPNYTGTVDQLFINRTSQDSKLEWVGEHSFEMERLQLARPWELSCFVYQQAVWLHHPDWSAMRGWRLQGPA